MKTPTNSMLNVLLSWIDFEYFIDFDDGIQRDFEGLRKEYLETSLLHEPLDELHVNRVHFECIHHLPSTGYFFLHIDQKQTSNNIQNHPVSLTLTSSASSLKTGLDAIGESKIS